MRKKSFLTRTVILLSLVSLFADINSEMLYPVMPVFLQSIGYSVVWIGLMEGFAEAIAGLSKIYFGRMSDATGRRMLFVRSGYALSTLAKAIPGIAQQVVAVFSSRTIDRFGKGLRTAARDSILSDESEEKHRGKVFGFHRALDTAGASIGPAIALLFLWFYPNQYTPLFLIAFVPGVAGVLLTLFVLEKKVLPDPHKKKIPFLKNFIFWKEAPSNYRIFVAGMLLFSLVNSSDFFLLLLLKMRGLTDVELLGCYIFYNLIYAGLAYAAGGIGDRFGLVRVLIVGLFLFVFTYLGFAFATELWQFLILLFLYGGYAACTDGIAKAIISRMIPKSQTASAIGFHAGWSSVALLFASSMTGLLWKNFGAALPMLISAGVTGLVILFFIFFSGKLALNKTER